MYLIEIRVEQQVYCYVCSDRNQENQSTIGGAAGLTARLAESSSVLLTQTIVLA